MSKLLQRTAFITGGANGIGRALCIEVARRGGQVVVADIELAKAERLAAELRANGAQALAVHCDVTQRDSIERARNAALDRFGAINLLCANAGVGVAGSILQTSEGDMRWLYEVNVLGTLRSVQVVTPLLLQAAERGEFAQVLITGSENSLGVPPVAACSVYTSTKHAVLGIADTLRRDLREAHTGQGAGVGVTLVCPALVNTEIWNAARNRHDVWGGAQQADGAIAAFMQQAHSAQDVAQLAIDGCETGEFIVIPHAEVAPFTHQRCRELLSALHQSEERARQAAT